jgi:hypothetical protein
MADKVIELLRLMEKFGVKPGRIIGAGDRKVTPIKKPILTKQLNRDYLLEDVEGGKIGTNTVKNEIEEVASLFFQKQLNDVEVNNLLNNLNYLDSLLNPTNIIDITTKAPVKGLESLRPTSIAGELEKAGKQLEEVGKKLEETTKPKSVIGDIMSDYASFQKVMQEENRKGLVRATTRSILYQDIKDGKIKGMTFEQLGSTRDPINDFRKIYGEDALEKLNTLTDDFSQMRTPEEAANFAKTRFKFEPRTSDLPETTTIEEAKKAEQEFGINEPAKVKDFKAEATKRTSIDDLIDEYNANQDRLLLTDDEGGTLITYPEYNRLKDRNDEIAKALEEKGIKSTPEVEEVPEGIVIPFKKKPPEEFAEGGITRTKFASGGKGKKVLDIIKNANKKLKGKKSMETVNPKTGEVITTKNPIMTVEDLQFKHKDAFNAHDQIFNVDINDKIAPDMIAESMAEMKGKDYFSLSQKEQSDLYKKALAYVDDVRMTKKQKPTMTPTLEEFKQTNPEVYDEFSKSTNRMQELLNFRSGQETFETFDLETYNYLNSQQIGRLLNQLKNPYKISDKERNLVRTGFTRENLEGTGLKNLDEINFKADKKQLETYLDDLYNKKQIEEAQIELSDLQDSGREPNANGGLNYLMGF